MHIFTKRGWRPLPIKAEPVPAAPQLYTGPIPSFECQAFIRQLERNHVEWVERRAALFAANRPAKRERQRAA
jgi:hypothetical protein